MKGKLSSFRQVNLVVWLGCACCGMAVQAADFPEPVSGVVTVTTAGTYAGTLPSGTTKLVVDAAGEVTLTGANASYSGATEVKAGSTLTIGQWNALGDNTNGKNGSVVVASGATLKVTFEKPSIQSQTVPGFYPAVTISGTGVGDVGALVFAQTLKTASHGDSVFNKVTLADDATVSTGGKRFGFLTLDLGGKTLTRIGADTLIAFGTTIKPGHIVNTTGTLTIQTATFSGCTPDNFSVTATGGTITLYGLATEFPGTLNIAKSAAFNIGSGNTADRNRVSGPFIVKADRTADLDIKTNGGKSAKYLTFNGPITNLSAKTIKFGVPTNAVNGGIHSPKGTVYVYSGFSTLAGTSVLTNLWAQNDSTRLDVKGTVDAFSLGGFAGSRTRICSPANVSLRQELRFGGGDLEIDGGVLTLGKSAMFRLANGGAVAGFLHMKSGSLTMLSLDTPFFGESTGSQGSFVMEGGTTTFSNAVYVTSNTGSHGLVVQKGGRWRTGNGSIQTKGGIGQIFQTGGTNDTTGTVADQTTRTLLGSSNACGALVVSGTGTVWATALLTLGNATNPTTNALVVSHGAALKATRFRAAPSLAAGSVAVVGVDGGILYPTMVAGWTGLNMGTATTHDRDFRSITVYDGGVTVDTSECVDGSGAPADSQCPHPFRAPEGRGIATITLPTSSEFAALAYRGPALIVIEGAGYGAAAFADYDYATRQLTGTVQVMCEGCNYDETTKVWVIGPAASPARYPCTFTLTSADRRGGGFTKRGAQSFALYNTNNWDGATVVEGGTLYVPHEGSVPSNRPLTVAKGAILSLNNRTLAVTSLAGAGTVYQGGIRLTDGGTIRVACAELFADGATSLTIGKALTLGSGTKVVVTDPENLSAYEERRPANFVQAASIAGEVPTLVGSDGVTPIARWSVRKKGGALSLGFDRGFAILLR